MYLGGGTSVFKLSSSGALLSPAAGFQCSGLLVSANDYETYDRAQNQLWLVHAVLQEIHVVKSDGTCVSGVLGFTKPQNALDTAAVAVDGGGNLWMIDLNDPGRLHELSPTGTILTPNTSNTSSGLYVLTYFLPNISPPKFSQAGSMAIDASGNIWAIDVYNRVLYKIPGLAAPKNYQ